MAGKETLLTQFMSITGVDNERATFFLESAGWNMDVAMTNFYDNDGGDGLEREAGEVTGAAAVTDTPPETAADTRPTRPQGRQPGIRTLGSLQPTEDSEDSEDENGQAFYAGGSEQSGQQILGPRRRRGEDIVKEMFKAAKGHGAEEVQPGEESAASARPAAFSGSGYRLGQTSDDSEVVAAPADRRPPQPRTVKLKLWKTGFSVDDGDVREYSDPANQEFLSAIRAGQVPPELIREAQGGEVHLDMEDHRHEEFEKPKPKLKSFSGKGYTLGSPGGAAAAGDEPALPGLLTWLTGLVTSLLAVLTQLVSTFFSPAPAVVGGAAAAAGPAAAAGDPVQAEAAARSALSLDEQQPVTSVQVRLMDGSRMVVRLNQSHTVGHLRQYIATARPEFSATPFTLLTTFPSKELSDDGVTIKDGQLLNAAVLQRAK